MFANKVNINQVDCFILVFFMAVIKIFVCLFYSWMQMLTEALTDVFNIINLQGKA